MNYTFLLLLLALLVIVSPFLLIGAYREGKRRRIRMTRFNSKENCSKYEGK